jgi:O-antigen/teichoic acid export membrane protein
MFGVSEKFIIQRFLSSNDLGIYSAYFDLTTKAFAFLLHPILLATKSRALSMSVHENINSSMEEIKKSIFIELLLLTPIMVVCFFLSDFLSVQVLHISNPPQFFAVMMPLFLSNFFWNLSLVVQLPFEIYGKTKLMMVLLGLCLVISILINLMLITYFGIVGVCYVELFSSVLYVIICFCVTQNLKKHYV